MRSDDFAPLQVGTHGESPVPNLEVINRSLHNYRIHTHTYILGGAHSIRPTCGTWGQKWVIRSKFICTPASVAYTYIHIYLQYSQEMGMTHPPISCRSLFERTSVLRAGHIYYKSPFAVCEFRRSHPKVDGGGSIACFLFLNFGKLFRMQKRAYPLLEAPLFEFLLRD